MNENNTEKKIIENSENKHIENEPVITPLSLSSTKSVENIFNLNNYEKEEGSGFYFKKDITFNNSEFKLIGVGCRYKILLSMYSVGIYINNIPGNLKIKNSIETILNDESKKILLLKIYREIDILSMISALNSAFLKRIEKDKKINQNLLHLEWILKKYIKNGLKQNDELLFEWDTNKINIYIGKNDKEINNSYFYEKIKENLSPCNDFKKIGEVEDLNICKTLFNCYLDNNSVTSSIKYSINKFILNLSGNEE